MTRQLTTDRVWKAIAGASFGVLGMVTARGESRTVGIIYVVHNFKLYIGAEPTQWKVRHIERNPHVSLTVAIPRRVPLLPWIKVPATTITFSGMARVVQRDELSADLLQKLYRHEEGRNGWCAIEVTPEKDFITYGVGVSVLDMRFPERSRGRAPVQAGSRSV